MIIINFCKKYKRIIIIKKMLNKFQKNKLYNSKLKIINKM